MKYSSNIITTSIRTNISSSRNIYTITFSSDVPQTVKQLIV